MSSHTTYPETFTYQILKSHHYSKQPSNTSLRKIPALTDSGRYYLVDFITNSLNGAATCTTNITHAKHSGSWKCWTHCITLAEFPNEYLKDFSTENNNIILESFVAESSINQSG